jgi:ATP-dependent helicase/nuclease subunit A
MTPVDQIQRDRFVSETDQNFSVQASAGAGKTTALVERVVHLAKTRPELLPRLVLVTYTNRAADEMRQRIRAKILPLAQENPGAHLLQGISQCFIGTLHSFCLKLIQEHALRLGYPVEIRAVAESDDAPFQIWNRQPTAPAPAWLPSLHRWISERELLDLAHRLTRLTVDWRETASVLEEDFSKTFAALRLDPSALDGIRHKQAKYQPIIDHWRAQWASFAKALDNPDNRFLFPPAYDKKGGEAFLTRWTEALSPLQQAVTQAAFARAARLAGDFQDFRFSQGTLYFSDQIVLARRLLFDPALRRALLVRGYRILLDEAQDTDPLQFQLLTELARDSNSTPFAWPIAGSDSSPNFPNSEFRIPNLEAPRLGHFAMVGDQQQAIYRDRASLALYRRYHDALSTPPAGEALTFSQTFRCRPAVVDFVNQRYTFVLDGQDGQTHYVNLQSRIDQGSGQVLRWQPSARPGNHRQKAWHEAEWLAREIKKTGLDGLRAHAWSDVAILTPSGQWLEVLHRALRKQHIPAVLEFDLPRYTEPAYLWLSALLTLHAEPNNEFEILGVLRELHGISDAELDAYRRAAGDERPRPFALREIPEPRSEIDRLLSEWWQLRAEAEDLPLADAVKRWSDGHQLRRRLASLPGGERHLRGLDQLLHQSHLAEQQGESIAGWAETLRDNVKEKKSVHGPEKAGALQLMTMKKAKGLEWDAVILPFLGRINREGGKSESLRWIAPVGSPDHTALKLPSGWESPHWQEQEDIDKIALRQERQRLFYVACTRPRHTLVLIDDAELWMRETKQGRRLSSPHGYEAMTGTAETAEAWTNPLEPHASLFTAASPDSSSFSTSPDSTVKDSLVTASFRLSEFQIPNSEIAVPSLTKRRPSTHTVELEDGALADDPRPTPPAPEKSWLPPLANDPIVYGLWWHDVMARQSLILDAVDTLPESLRDRGKTELTLYLRSDLHRRLQATETLREVPYVRNPGEAVIEEGVIDLLYPDANGKWILLDWKTDQNTNPQMLASRYRSQLEAYAAACQEFGLSIAGLEIYSTALGQVIAL